MKTSKIQNICFNIFLIIGSSSLLSSNIMMRNHLYTSYLIPFIIMPILLIITFIYNNKIKLKEIINKKFIKIISLLYIFLSTFIHVLAYLKITNDYYYNLTSPFIILCLILLLSLFISTYGINHIFNVGFIGSIFFILIFILININNKSYIINNNMVINNDGYNIKYIFNYLFIYLDILFISIFNNFNSLNKKHFSITIFISIILNSYLILQNYLFFNVNFFISNKVPYISKFLLISYNNIFEHLDIIYLCIITFFIIFKLAIYCEIYRIILKIKRKSFQIFIFPLSIIIIILISSLFPINLKIINIIMFITSFTLIILFLILKAKTWRFNNEKSR